MRLPGLTAILGLAVLNCFLGCSGQRLAYEMHRVVAHDRIMLPLLSEVAFALQPWFYVVAVAVVLFGGLGLAGKLSEKALMYGVVGFLILDVAWLVVSLWGFSMVHFLL
jgi:hypothetical protein